MKDINLNAAAGVARQAKFFPDEEAIVYGQKTWTYAQLEADVRSLAQTLLNEGTKPGDRVAYLGLNSFSFIETMLASWWIGAVFEPLNFRLAPLEVRDLLQRSRPVLLLVEPTHQSVIDQIPELETTIGLTKLVMIDTDEEVPAPAGLPLYYARLSETRAGESEISLGAPVDSFDEDLGILMFTSGTTGMPKGVQITHGNIWWNSVNVDSLVDTRRGDTNLAVAPLFHIGGLNALTIRSIVRGGRTVIRRNFDPRQVLLDIEKYSVSQAFLVPAMLAAMQQTEEFGHVDISSLRALICAGAPVPPILLAQYKAKDVDVQQAWGLTETSPFATYLPRELTHKKPGSCGLPMPYTEVRIVDPVTMQDVEKDGQTGEMLVRGPNVTSGYWENPEATSGAFHEGWFRSGDIGYRDSDGYLYIVDRLKDMIISGGENIYPAEVERALSGFPGLTDVAVVGVEDEKWGERVVAVVSCKPGVNPTVEELRDYAESHLARFKLPKDLVMTTEVPRNGAGKLDKLAIRSLASQR
ncbi:acyl-CoA synthetase [Glutamicibacter protophormiae]|uniref:Fatty-acyl-CoA synthase n=1 Tax=Glutamicibacter protophormiae TaxID=37930 RepID=A0ABS4XL62_GLUPR|nr:long-chain fatty acid--CoA ligase [Glutamicibacter protophormiae]MBP2397247.1 fatty-acyl-CoA synthase [Glutamicibacter protophormiae]GGL80712.1 acyl-CoA synthetase [Glutamicibacter protophormiae]